jgi:hypothetical protein
MIKKSFIATITVLLLVISILAEMHVVEVVEANPYYPPKWKVESPQNNTIYNTNSINLSLIVESDFENYDYYYSIDTPITVDMQSIHDGEEGKGKVPINVTLISETPLNPNGWTRNNYQFSTQLYNLSNGQHVLTLYHGYYDFILTDWRHENPSATIIFSIDTTAPTFTPIPIPSINQPTIVSNFLLSPLLVILVLSPLNSLINFEH